MPNIYQGRFSAKGKRFGIVVSRFNEFITGKLYEGAMDCLNRHGAEDKNIDVYYVPGSFDIPVMTNKILAIEKYNAMICLGAVIRGQTPHFDYIASEVSRGIGQVALKHNVPVIFGVLTTDTVEQAIERAGTKAGNKGWDAALSAIEMADMFDQLKS